MLNNTFLIFLVDFLLILFVIFIINKKIRNKLEILSTIDPLTKIKNRNMYNELLAFELELNKRYEVKTAFIILDIDLFKNIKILSIKNNLQYFYIIYSKRQISK